MQPMHTIMFLRGYLLAVPAPDTGGLAPQLCQMVIWPCLPWTHCLKRTP